MEQNKTLLYILPLLLLLLFFFSSESKPKRRKKRTIKTKVYKPVVKKASKASKADKEIRKISDMPKKYRNGCSGKKGAELGKCLQYWRRYRKYNPIKR
jgi:hypothetical protein